MANIYMRVTGNDANDGSTPALAVATLARAQVVASAGDTINVGGGTYNEVAPALTKNNLIILGDPLGTATGDAGLVRINNPDVYPALPFNNSTATGVVFRNIALTTTVVAYALYNLAVDNSTYKFIDCIIWGGNGMVFGGSYINCLIYGLYMGNHRPQLLKNSTYGINTIENGGPLSMVTNYNMGYSNSSYIEDPTNNNFKLKTDYLANIEGAGTTDADLDNTDILGKSRNTTDPWIGPYDAGSYVVDKLLIQDGSNIYTLSSGSKVLVNAAPVTEAMFEASGLNDLSEINDTTIRLFTNPKILLYKT